MTRKVTKSIKTHISIAVSAKALKIKHFPFLKEYNPLNNTSFSQSPKRKYELKK